MNLLVSLRSVALLILLNGLVAVTEAEPVDPCFEAKDPISGSNGNCLTASACGNGTYITGVCPSYPNDYVCCFNAKFPGRELRGAWIATVENIDFPKSRISNVSVQQAELRFLIDRLHEAKINAIYFQVRPAGDALYNSSIEPWSKYLIGVQGTAPQPLWDPLAFVISYCKEFNIAVHAWINPYRANLEPSTNGLAGNHMALQFPKYAYPYSTYLWMDPGAEEVQNRTYDVAIDLVTRYDLDGIHMDDYFYPYPVVGELFPDNATYAAYLQSGGSLALDDWRRDNVNKLIERMYNGVHQVKPWMQFSISPFGIYRAGHPEGMPSPIAGFDQYSEIYCDAKLWLQKGWVDALQPQLYWRIDPPAQSYPVLLDWWVEQNILGRHVYAGNYLTRVELDGWTLEEMGNQVAISQQAKNRLRGSWGNIMFSAKMIRDDVKGLIGFFNTTIYPHQALQPQFPWLASASNESNMQEDASVPRLEVKGQRVTVILEKAFQNEELWNKIAIYQMKQGEDAWKILMVVANEGNKGEELMGQGYELSAGRFAISFVNRFGMESPKAYFEIV